MDRRNVSLVALAAVLMVSPSRAAEPADAPSLPEIAAGQFKPEWE